MNRRQFFKALGVATATVCVAPTKVLPAPDPFMEALLVHKLSVERALLFGVDIYKVDTSAGIINFIRHGDFFNELSR